MLEDFADYNDFLDAVDLWVEQFGWEGELQVASFHPQYQFADTEAEDPGNLTNRSPWPLLHHPRGEPGRRSSITPRSTVSPGATSRA